MSAHVLAIDQGTSATKCVLVSGEGRIVAKASAPVGESYPESGWVEQDGDAIWASARSAVEQCLAKQPGVGIVAVGLSTQRESAIVWQRSDGRALTPLLSWQDQRTVALRDHNADGKFDRLDPLLDFRLQTIIPVSDRPQVSWAAMPGRAYQLVYRDAITGAWMDLPGSLTNAGPLQTTLGFPDPGLFTNGQRFYKVKLLP